MGLKAEREILLTQSNACMQRRANRIDRFVSGTNGVPTTASHVRLGQLVWGQEELLLFEM